MNADDKATALKNLYDHIARVAVAMNGKPYRAVEHLNVPAAIVAEPHGEDVPTVRVTMPNGFEVEIWLQRSHSVLETPYPPERNLYLPGSIQERLHIRVWPERLDARSRVALRRKDIRSLASRLTAHFQA